MFSRVFGIAFAVVVTLGLGTTLAEAADPKPRPQPRSCGSLAEGDHCWNDCHPGGTCKIFVCRNGRREWTLRTCGPVGPSCVGLRRCP
jgi:hypothetical protein